MKLSLLALAPLLAVVGCTLSSGNPEDRAATAAAEMGPTPQLMGADTTGLYGQLDSVLEVREVDMKSTLDVHLIRRNDGELFLSAMDTRQGGIFDLGFSATTITSASSTGNGDVAIAGVALTGTFNSSAFVLEDGNGIVPTMSFAQDAATPEATTSLSMATDEAIDELSELNTMQTGKTPNGTSVRLFDMKPETADVGDHLLFHIGSGSWSKTYDLELHVDRIGDMTVVNDTTVHIEGQNHADGSNFVYTLQFDMGVFGSAPSSIAMTRLE